MSIPYNRQGLIYFTCLNIEDQPEHIRKKVLELCIRAAGENNNALYEVLTNSDIGIPEIAIKYGISEKMICNCRQRFYEIW